MKLRIARKILKRYSDQIRNHDFSTVPLRLVARATIREQRWKRTHRVNRDLKLNPAPSDLHNSRYRTRRCQPKAELIKLWIAQ
jgi:hypothetical protein